MKRTATGVLILAVVGGLTVLALAWAAVARALQHTFGFYNGAGNSPQYLFWSGSGSDLAYLGIAAGTVSSAMVLYRKHNCHEPGCWRIGKVAVDSKGTLTCWRHHPDGKPAAGHIARAHADHAEHLRQQLHLYLGKQPGKG